MAVPIRTQDPSVYIDGNEVVIVELREGDSDFVELVRESNHPEQAAHRALAVGARALRGAQGSLDAAVIERRFAEFEGKLARGVDGAVTQIGQRAGEFLDPERGALRKMLDELRGGLEKSLGDTFDPKSKASVLAKFETLFTGETAALMQGVRNLVDPGNAESPLGRLRAELRTELKDVRQALDQLRTQIAVEQTELKVLELTAIKGRQFEETVFDAASAFVSLYGDEAELVGTSAGSNGGRHGDVLVTINEADTPGTSARYVIEVKDRKVSLREATGELGKAMKNRDAKAGVIVFSAQSRAPIPAPLQLYGNKAIVVLDKHDPDDRPLRLALMAARCAVQRQLNGVGPATDLESALALIEQGQRALACHSAIKRCHTSAQNQIESAAGQVTALVEELDEILRQLAAKLRR